MPAATSLRGRLHAQVLALAERAGIVRMDDHRHAGRLDVVDQQVGLGGAVEPDLDVELLGQPQRAGDVLRPVRP